MLRRKANAGTVASRRRDSRFAGSRKCVAAALAAACEAGEYTGRVALRRGKKMRRRSLPLEPARTAAGTPVPSVQTLARRLAEVQSLRRLVHIAEQRQARGEAAVVYAPKVLRRATQQRAH